MTWGRVSLPSSPNPHHPTSCPRLGKRHLGLWGQITQAENHIRAGQQPPVSSNMVCDRKSSFVYDFPMKCSISWYVYVNIYIYICVCVCIYIYIWLYIYIYMYIGDGDYGKFPLPSLITGWYLDHIYMVPYVWKYCIHGDVPSVPECSRDHPDPKRRNSPRLRPLGEQRSASRVPFQSPESVWEPFRLVMIQVWLEWKNCALRFSFSIWVFVLSDFTMATVATAKKQWDQKKTTPKSNSRLVD